MRRDEPARRILLGDRRGLVGHVFERPERLSPDDGTPQPGHEQGDEHARGQRLQQLRVIAVQFIEGRQDSSHIALTTDVYRAADGSPVPSVRGDVLRPS